MKILNLGFDFFFFLSLATFLSLRESAMRARPLNNRDYVPGVSVFPLLFLSQCAVISAEAVTQNRESKKSEP